MYDYMEEMKDDILTFFKDGGFYDNTKFKEAIINEDEEDLRELLNDELWAVDRVTGNGSGSYFFNREKARKAMEEDGEEYFQDAVEDFGIEATDIAEHLFDYEWMDVTVRCYLLGQVIDDLIDNDWNELTDLILHA